MTMSAGSGFSSSRISVFQVSRISTYGKNRCGAHRLENDVVALVIAEEGKVEIGSERSAFRSQHRQFDESLGSGKGR
jgi:hypothetical protein